MSQSEVSALHAGCAPCSTPKTSLYRILTLKVNPVIGERTGVEYRLGTLLVGVSAVCFAKSPPRPKIMKLRPIFFKVQQEIKCYFFRLFIRICVGGLRI